MSAGRAPRIAEIASEVAPWSKTGGLADVAGSLPPALRRAGADVVVVTPRYRGVAVEATPLRVRVPLGDRLVEAAAGRGELPGGVPAWFVDAPEFFDRERLYGTAAADYPDNAARFAFFARAAIELLRQVGPAPDVFHVHDWQAGLVPALLKTRYADVFPRAKSVLTIHNLAYQGLFPAEEYPLTGLDPALFNWRQLEFHGKVSYLKAGVVFADAVTTVSPTYAREILDPLQGCGFDGILRDRADRLHGILNGVDTDEWNPQTDLRLPARYSATDLAGKAACRRELQRRFGLPERPEPLVLGFVGRLVEQKGVDLVADAATALAGLDLQLVMLGTGDPVLQDRLKAAAEAHPSRLALRVGFDDAAAHLVEAGADAFLMPSRFEPCGLNQMYSLRYGTPPIVRRTGGLADTVVPATPAALRKGTANGFVFEEATPSALLRAVRQAIDLRRDPAAWASLQRAGMARDVSWGPGAARYLEIFRELAGS